MNSGIVDPRAVLVVDDDRGMRQSLCDILKLDDYQPTAAASVMEMDSLPHLDGYLAVLLDRKLPDGVAEQVLPRLKQRAPDTAVIVITGFSDLDGAIAALRAGATDYLLKPINPEVLRASLARIAAQWRLALAKRRSDSAFRNLVEAAQSVIVILSMEHVIEYMGPYAEELTGYPAEEVVGASFPEIFVPPNHRASFAEQLQAVARGERRPAFEQILLDNQSQTRWLVWNARTITLAGQRSLLVVGQDVTELKQAQARAVQAERLAAIGQMMTGLAHESRNALQRSQACLGMLARRIGDQPQLLELIAGIQEAQYDLSRLYESVRSYAAPLNLRRQKVVLPQVLEEAWGHLEATRQNRDAALSIVQYTPDATCHVDPFMIEQVFRNLLENALTFADPVKIDVEFAQVRFNDVDSLRIVLRDNGPGLDAETQRRIFEPFFTTKIHGTGLGIPIAKRIVEAHHGQIRLPPQSGPGAVFELLLPRSTP